MELSDSVIKWFCVNLNSTKNFLSLSEVDPFEFYGLIFLSIRNSDTSKQSIIMDHHLSGDASLRIYWQCAMEEGEFNLPAGYVCKGEAFPSKFLLLEIQSSLSSTTTNIL